MKQITVLLASIAKAAFGHKKIWTTFDDKQAIKNKVEFYRKRDRRK